MTNETNGRRVSKTRLATPGETALPEWMDSGFDDEQTFDVTCVIGSVKIGAGTMSPHVAAFALIAEHDAPGRYSFPMAHGGMCHVTVEHEPVA